MYRNGDDTVRIEGTLPGDKPSWIGLTWGFDMVNSDLFWIRYDGTEVILQDLYSYQNMQPKIDTNNNLSDFEY